MKITNLRVHAGQTTFNSLRMNGDEYTRCGFKNQIRNHHYKNGLEMMIREVEKKENEKEREENWRCRCLGLRYTVHHILNFR